MSTAKNWLAAALAAVALACGGCSPHKIEIPQGSRLVFEKVAALSEGQTKDEVRALLGPAHVVSTLQPNRWHYFSLVRTGDPTSALLALELEFGEDGTLEKIVVSEAEVENLY